MSIADHFDHTPDAAFIRNYDSGAARRQFNVSLILILVIAIAATALGMLVRFDSPSFSLGQQGSAVQPMAGPAPSYAGKL